MLLYGLWQIKQELGLENGLLHQLNVKMQQVHFGHILTQMLWHHCVLYITRAKDYWNTA